MDDIVPVERIASKIYVIRQVKVMLDRDLAELYGVETRRLKEQVKRNLDRFPEDFMFELTKKELKDWRSQFATSNKDFMGLRVPRLLKNIPRSVIRKNSPHNDPGRPGRFFCRYCRPNSRRHRPRSSPPRSGGSCPQTR